MNSIPDLPEREKGLVMIRGVIFMALSGLLLSFPGCQKKTEEDRVKEVIADIQKAGQEKDIRKIIGHLSRNYSDSQGNDYNSIKGLLLAYFFRHQRIHIFIPAVKVTVEDSAAKVAFETVFSGGGATGSPSGIFPDAVSMYAFDVSMKKEDGEWMVLSARWNPVSENR